MNSQTGIFYDVPDDEYRSIDAVGSSVVKTAASLSAAHSGVKTGDSPSMFKGRLAHCMLLEPDSTADRYERQLEGHGSSKAVKESKASIMASGKTPVTKSDWDSVSAAVEAANASPVVEELLSKGRPEVTVVWRDESTKLMCKARIDWLRDDEFLAIDLKTTSTFGGASPHTWSRQVRRYGLPIQAVHYLEGLSVVTGLVWDWRWLALELTPPFGMTLFEPDSEVLAAGHDGWRRGLSRLKEASVSGSKLSWPMKTYIIGLDGVS
tara:strand:+ start:1236 stop:2030 length:795 start_codon:yes stop_codon:yes gene_type:complete